MGRRIIIAFQAVVGKQYLVSSYCWGPEVMTPRLQPMLWDEPLTSGQGPGRAHLDFMAGSSRGVISSG